MLPMMTLTAPNHHSFYILRCLAFVPSYWANKETSNLVYRLTVANPSLRITNYP